MQKSRVVLVLAVLLTFLKDSNLQAVEQSVANYAVELSASVQTEPLQISLAWRASESATGYRVYRKAKEAVTWEEPVSLGADAQGFVDTNVLAGVPYEYHVWRTSTNHDSHGYILSAIDAPLVESRGKIVLVVDQTYVSTLAPELARLEQDLVGDGWAVLRHNVPRMLISPAEQHPAVWMTRSNEVAAVKALIRTDYLIDRANVRAVLLFGHVPVPYSGFLAPDSHPDHRGAWPADVYYADMEGTWTDSTVDTITAADPRNRNVPGDGKFDQTYTPAKLALEVGRIDFAGLPGLGRTELDMLREYLNKNHAFRHGALPVRPQALVSDNLGILNLEIPAANGWANFAPLFGPTNVIAGRWLSEAIREPYLWAYGCGSGTYSRALGVIETSHFQVYDPKVVFALLFGSYFGDWDSTDNLLRASLAGTSHTLAAIWSGRPNWFIHPMAVGETIGHTAALAQNNAGLYLPSRIRPTGIGFGGEDPTNSLTGVHIALMGDPTVRLHPLTPPANFTAVTNTGGGVDLAWTAPSAGILGYNLYRAPTAGGPYARLNASLLTDVAYTDWTNASDRYYMLRAVALQASASGSYFNASQGVFATVNLRAASSDDSAWLGGGSREWVITDATGSLGAHPGWDLQKVQGVLTVAATINSPFTIQIVSRNSQGQPGAPANFDKDTPYFWPILIGSDPVFGFDPTRIKLVTEGFNADLGGGRFNLAISEDQRVISVVFNPNHAPVAAPALYNRAWDEPLRVEIPELLARFTSDPDNDLRALVQVGSSTNGTTITSDGTFLVFASTNNVAETVSYWVQDVREYRGGDTVQTASSTITIEPLPRGAQFTAFHAIEIEWQGEAGQLYQVQSRPETGAPWVNEGPIILGAGEKMSLFQRASDSTKFYRVISVNEPQLPAEPPLDPGAPPTPLP